MDSQCGRRGLRSWRLLDAPLGYVRTDRIVDSFLESRLGRKGLFNDSNGGTGYAGCWAR